MEYCNKTMKFEASILKILKIWTYLWRHCSFLVLSFKKYWFRASTYSGLTRKDHSGWKKKKIKQINPCFRFILLCCSVFVFLLGAIKSLYQWKQTWKDHKLLQILTFLQLRQSLIGLISLLLQDLTLTIKSKQESRENTSICSPQIDAAHF